MFICLGCSDKPNNETKTPVINSQLIIAEKKEFDSLAKTVDTGNLKLLIGKTDSILLNKNNQKIGYYFHLRGVCFTGLENFKDAILNLKKAKELGYNPEKCQFLIDFNESMIAIEKAVSLTL